MNYNNGFCSGKGNSDVVFDFKVVSVGNFSGAMEKYKELRRVTNRSGYSQDYGKELDYDQNFILLNDRMPGDDGIDSPGRVFGNFGTVSINVPGQLSHEMGHIMGYGYTDAEGTFNTHPVSTNNGIMSGNVANRRVTQEDIDRFNFGYGLTNAPRKGDVSRDQGQLMESFPKSGVQSKYVGTSSRAKIFGPFSSSVTAIKTIDAIK